MQNSYQLYVGAKVIVDYGFGTICVQPIERETPTRWVVNGLQFRKVDGVCVSNHSYRIDLSAKEREVAEVECKIALKEPIRHLYSASKCHPRNVSLEDARAFARQILTITGSCRRSEKPLRSAQHWCLE